MTKTVVAAIEQARLDKGFSPAEVAGKLGVSLRTYQRIQSGQLTLNQLCLLCEMFDLDLFNLNGAKDKPQSQKDWSKILQDRNRLKKRS